MKSKVPFESGWNGLKLFFFLALAFFGFSFACEDLQGGTPTGTITFAPPLARTGDPVTFTLNANAEKGGITKIQLYLTFKGREGTDYLFALLSLGTPCLKALTATVTVAVYYRSNNSPKAVVSWRVQGADSRQRIFEREERNKEVLAYPWFSTPLSDFVRGTPLKFNGNRELIPDESQSGIAPGLYEVGGTINVLGYDLIPYIPQYKNAQFSSKGTSAIYHLAEMKPEDFVKILYRIQIKGLDKGSILGNLFSGRGTVDGPYGEVPDRPWIGALLYGLRGPIKDYLSDLGRGYSLKDTNKYPPEKCATNDTSCEPYEGWDPDLFYIGIDPNAEKDFIKEFSSVYTKIVSKVDVLGATLWQVEAKSDNQMFNLSPQETPRGIMLVSGVVRDYLVLSKNGYFDDPRIAVFEFEHGFVNFLRIAMNWNEMRKRFPRCKPDIGCPKRN